MLHKHSREDITVKIVTPTFELETVTSRSTCDLDQDLVVRAMRETDAVRMNACAPVPRPVPRVDIWMDDLSSTFANGLRVVRACYVRPPLHGVTDL